MERVYMTRKPIVAGTFYEGSAAACRKAVRSLLEQAQLPEDLPKSCKGGIVPHAGWICSGGVAAQTFKALAGQWSGKTVLLFGAVHAYSSPLGMLYASGGWETPLGQVEIDEELASVIAQNCHNVTIDPEAHAIEHSLEVQLPFVQVCWPKARIVPVLVPGSPLAGGIGQQIGQLLSERDEPVLVIGSSDLTHYGPRYGITPAGVGLQGIEWANENDERLLRLIETMSADGVIDEACERLNACGAGAIAATIAACGALGAKRGIVLRHTNSYETLKDLYPADASDAVGYASVVFA